MNDGNILIHAFKIEGNGKGRPVDLNAVRNWSDDKGLLWVHLNSMDEHAPEWLMENFGIASLTCESLFDQGTRPRSTMLNDGLLVISTGE